ncbi:MAG: hypothetical protein GXP14_02765 [Gammaproteobacteria bacterium]|nr:hypothetical protein [Gammaproteobacteria bacterium]
MKTSDSQEIKTIYIHEVGYSKDDEINLLDLIVVLIRHKILIITIFTACIILGLTKALNTPKTYTYRTTIEIGSQVVGSRIVPLESPNTLLAKLEYSHVPQILNKLRQQSPDDKKKHQIRSIVPSGSKIVLLEATGTKEQEDTLKKILQQISQKVIQDHTHIFQSLKENLEATLNLANKSLNSFKGNNNYTEIVMNQNIIESISSQLANLRNTREILPPTKSLYPISKNQKATILIAAFTGLFLGILTAFFIEFLSQVRKKIATDKA